MVWKKLDLNLDLYPDPFLTKMLDQDTVGQKRIYNTRVVDPYQHDADPDPALSERFLRVLFHL